MTVTPSELTPERMAKIVDLIQVIAGPTPPEKVPSRPECRVCNIGQADCPERVREYAEPVAVAAEF